VSARASLAAGLIIIASSGASGCHHRSRSNANAPSASQDSLAGVVSVTGTSFEQHLVLRVEKGARELAASRDDSSALSRLGGTEVIVYGAARTERFAVTAFTVKSVGGAPVVDGLLQRDGTHFILHTREAILVLGNPPAAFDSLVGARIWIGGPLDSGPNVYGVIVPPSPR